jgi:hypothetical protein
MHDDLGHATHVKARREKDGVSAELVYFRSVSRPLARTGEQNQCDAG